MTRHRTSHALRPFVAVLALAIVARPLAAQRVDSLPAPATRVDSAPAPAPSTAGMKRPGVARALASIPGGGPVYAGAPTRGLAFVGGMAGVLALGTVMIAGQCVAQLGNDDPNQSDRCGTPLLVNSVVVAFYGVWGWSIYDAGRTAQRTNARRRRQASLILAPGARPRGVRFGIRIGAR